MSKKNSLEQKQIRRKERELHKERLQAKEDKQIYEVEEVYKKLYEDYKSKKKLDKFDDTRILQWLENRIGKVAAYEFVKSVEKGGE